MEQIDMTPPLTKSFPGTKNSAKRLLRETKRSVRFLDLIARSELRSQE